MTAAAITGSKASLLPKIHYFGEVDSTFDVAFHLAREGRLPDWDSVVARSQTGGRGQMRRHWDSPPGNLYASMRLPLAPPFNSNAASVAVGAVCANALRSYGCPVQLKWPNDLVVPRNGSFGKLAGILLEQRDGCLLAGIGINIASAPKIEDMRDGSALPAAALDEANPAMKLPTPGQLWQRLVRHFYSVYRSGSFFARIWKDAAEELLLWRGELVTIQDGEECRTGLLKGIGEQGGALLESGGSLQELFSGNMLAAGKS